MNRSSVLIGPLPNSIVIKLTFNTRRRWQFSAGLTHPAAKDGGEDLLLAAVIHLGEGEVVEMASEAWSDRISSPSRRSHGADKINIYQLLKRTFESAKSGMSAEL